MAEAVAGRARFEMRGVRKSFGATAAVDGVDLTVRAGEVCALVGQNGAGKSTLMAILSGALHADAGSMTLDGNSYAPRNPADGRAAGVAMIYQELSLAPHLSVMDNVVLGIEPARRGILDRRRMRELTREALERLGHGGLDVTAAVGRLPVALQQIVEIARAIVVGSRVVVLDEPTSSLGRPDAERLFAIVAQLRRDGRAVVYISHFIEEVKTVADRIVVLRDGRLVGEAPATAPATEIVSMMVGGRVEELYPRTPREPGERLLAVDGLESLSAPLELRRGEILGLAGLLGAGRSRFLRTLFGLAPVRAGTVTVGSWSGRPDPHHQWARGVGMVSEDRKGEGLATSLSIADNLTLPRLRGLGPGPLVLRSRQNTAAQAWMDRLGIRAHGPEQRTLDLSGGNQQKVAFARLLYHDADVLLLDEPTRGIDVGSKAQIYAVIDALVAKNAVRPRGIILVSSYLPELLGVCDRIAVMRRGVLAHARPASEYTEHTLMLAATGAEHAA
jgi:ribose transport system ATP-binding protein